MGLLRALSRWAWWPLLLTALAYGLAGRLALSLALPPAFAAPLFPAAGIALAATLVWGRRMFPAVVIGSLLVNGPLGEFRMLDSLQAAISTSVIALGAGLQAVVGAAWVRHLTPNELALDEPREALALGLLGGPLACLINASLSTGTLWATGGLPTQEVFGTWITWWSGDTLGVLIAAPISLCFIGHPRALWHSRRMTVALPLVTVTTVLVVASLLVARADAQRRTVQFQRDAHQMADALEIGLQHPLHALDAMRGLYVVSDKVTHARMEAATRSWFSQKSGLQAMGFAQKVLRSQIASFESEVREDGLSDYRFFERPDGAALARQDAYVLAIRHVEPLTSNAGALGVNVLSAPAARDAIERAVAEDLPVASAAFRLTQSQGDETGVVVYRPVSDRPLPADAHITDLRLRGVVFVTLQTDAMARAMLGSIPAHMRWCLVDRSPQLNRIRLAGATGCELTAAEGLHVSRKLSFAGRQWELIMSASPASLPGAQRWSLWFFSLIGLGAVAMLSALLLSITGRARRVEQAVTERTVDLSREVHERQRTEAALRESEQRIRNILDHVPLGIVYTGVEGGIRETNPQMRTLLGLDATALHGRAINALPHPSDRQVMENLIQRVRRDPSATLHQRMRLMGGDGQVLWVQVGLSALRNAQGEAWRLVGVFEDITEHLKLAEAEKAREMAEAASRAKSDFLSRMSHELRTPLNAILGFAQLLALDRHASLSPQQTERVAQIQQAGWHLVHMIDDMLDLSRIEAGHMRLEPAAVSLREVLVESLGMVQSSAQSKGVSLIFDHHGDPCWVEGDRTRIKQILTNLCSNAVKYNRDGGEVRCSIGPGSSPGTLTLAVQDTGLGLDEHQVRQLFQPFNRAGREKTKIEGTGLGLVISRRLAELMHGSLTVESQSGEGSVFSLTLPCALNPGDQPSSLVMVDDPSPVRSQRRVLYVEDNETNAEVMRGLLSRRPQVVLEVAKTGQDGLAQALTALPDVILLDMQLPDMDGLSILRVLRSNPSTDQVPVMMVSADATSASIEDAFREGATDYVTKPLDMNAFLGQLDQILGRLENHPPA